jgi:hypothetical protein
MKLNFDNIRSCTLRLFKTVFLTLALWLSAFSLQEIDPGYISEDLLHYIYYDGRNTHTILYDDINKTDENYYETNMQEYYNNLYETEIVKQEVILSEPDFLKQNFTKILLNKYGNSIILRIDIKDLELLVNTTILTDVQSFMLWELLLQHKGRRISTKTEYLPDSEVYIFNIISLKTQAVLIFSMLTFLTVHNIQIFFLRRDKTTVIFNICTISLSLFLAYKLYTWQYYISSSIILFQLCIALKFMIESLFIHAGFNKEDFDILVSAKKTKNALQFGLKFILYFSLAATSGLLSFLYFNYIINYIVFYACMIQIIYLISYYFQYDVSPCFQPFKHVLLTVAGIINFFITKRYTRTDSFYILSDSLSIMCMSYISDYLYTQINNISYMFYEKELDEDKIYDKITEIVKDVKEHRSFFQDQNSFLWLIVFKFGFIFNLIGYYYSSYITYYFSLYYFKFVLSIFGRCYSERCLRILYGLLFFVLIITNHLLKDDEIFNDILGLTGFNFLIKAFLKFSGLIYIIGIVIINNYFFFNIKKELNNDLNEEDAEELFKNFEISATIEKKKKKRTKTIEIIIKEPSLKFNSILYIHTDLSIDYINICLMLYLIKDVEKSYIMLCLYIFSLAIFLIRTLFIISEMKNDYEYLYAFMIALILGIRLMTITRDNSPLYICSCFYMLSLITLYCIIDRRRFLATMIIIFHLLSACLYFTSAFLLILIAIVICLPLAFKRQEKRYNQSTVTIILPCVVVVIFQIYGLRSIFARLLEFEDGIKYAFQFDVFGSVQSIVHGYRNEFSLLQMLFEMINKIN